MKPLELTWFDQNIRDLGWTLPNGTPMPPRVLGYNKCDRLIPMPWVGDIVQEKRLTDAELAAEYWRAEADLRTVAEYSRVPGWFKCCLVKLRFVYTEDVDYSDGYVDYEIVDHFDKTILRFATTPSYDEQDNA